MSYVAVRFQDGPTEGLRLMTLGEYEGWVDAMGEGPVEGVGVEAYALADSASDFFRTYLAVEVIGEVTYRGMYRVFGKGTFGDFPEVLPWEGGTPCRECRNTFTPNEMRGSLCLSCCEPATLY